MTIRRLALLLLAAGAVTALAYVRGERRSGAGYFVEDPTNVRFFIDQALAPGLRNTDDEIFISAESAPQAAVASAMRTWSSLPGSILNLAAPESTAASDAELDGRNVITFADRPEHRSIVGGAIAVTLLFSNLDGMLTDTDIVFNPAEPFSTTAEPAAFDLEGILVHELGHAIGADHSSSADATMFATVVRQSTDFRSLSADDRAFAADLYPSPNADVLFGDLTGRVTRADGQAVRSAVVAAQDDDSNVTISALTDRDGFYQMRVPPGTYRVYVEPLDGPARSLQLGPSRSPADQAFTTTFVGGADNPTLIPVGFGNPVTVDVEVDATLSLLNVQGVGVSVGGADPRGYIGAPVQRGTRARLEAFGTAFDAPGMNEAAVSFLGSGLALVPGSFNPNVGRIRRSDGTEFRLIGFEVDVAAGAPLGTVSVRFRTPDGLSVMTGGIEIMEAIGRPSFSASAVVNAAGFAGGSIAPGQIVTIFGSDLGPRNASSPSFFDPITGRLTESLDDVTVLFDGRPGAVFFASDVQVNVQAPTDLAAGQTAIEVAYLDRRSAPVTVSITGEAPGLFTFEDGTRVVAVNEDGTINGPENRALPGTVVTFYGTGQGSLDGPLATGETAGSGPQLRRVAGTTTLTVGGAAADVLFAGMTPGFVGLMQVNSRLGATTPSGEVAVVLRIRGSASRANAVIWVE